ncbi:hypothetical protein KUCAC02_006390, partial [Chaenocephalus aceratus]
SGGLLQSTGVRETFGPGFVGKFGSGASFFEEEIKGLCQNQTRETAWTCPRVSCIHTSRLSTARAPPPRSVCPLQVSRANFMRLRSAAPLRSRSRLK